jgi:hypothetical protein
VQSYLLLLESCELVSPGFKAATNAVNAPWRRQTQKKVAAVESSAEYRAALAAAPQRLRTMGSKELEELKDMCGQLRHALEVRPRDARLATAVSRLAESGGSHDSARVLERHGATQLQGSVREPSGQRLRQMGGDFAKFGITDSFRQGGALQEGFAVTHDGKGFITEM